MARPVPQCVVATAMHQGGVTPHYMSNPGLGFYSDRRNVPVDHDIECRLLNWGGPWRGVVVLPADVPAARICSEFSKRH